MDVSRRKYIVFVLVGLQAESVSGLDSAEQEIDNATDAGNIAANRGSESDAITRKQCILLQMQQ
jgi:hypothetical protein